MKKILVTGAGGPAGVNFIMSLGIAPEKVFTVGTEANEYFFHLIPADKKHLITTASEANYIDQLNEIIRKERVEFIHAQPDIEVAMISEKRENLEADVFLPSKEAIHVCQDKIESARLWEKRDVPVARFRELHDETDVDKVFEEFGTPIWIRARYGAGGRGSTPAYNKETALSWIRYWKSRNIDWLFVAQEHLPGRNVGFHSLWKEGELVTSMARERLQYIYPHLAPSGITGTPSVQRTIHDDKVNEVGARAVLSIDPNFNGIACVDLKEDKEELPCVTEINAGRMFTTSYFFSYASKVLRKDHYANIPYLYVKLAFKENISGIPKNDILPQNIYWIRHIDAPARLVKDGKSIGEMYG
jgi:glutathione synthase/RimK-type ligase-like ATP-grasp enzyme